MQARNRLFVTAGLALASFGSIATHSAEPLPRYGVDQMCLEMGQRMNSAEMRNACVEREQGAYDALRAAWPQIDATVQRKCVGEGVGVGSYFCCRCV